MSEKFRPLNDEQINRLDDLLATAPEESDTLDVSMLDGYLSAIALLNPALETESEWYPFIFDTEGRETQVENPEEVRTLIMQRFQEIRAFQAQREFYNPIIFPIEDEAGEPILGKDGLVALAPWATGFYVALSQFSDRVALTAEVEAALLKINRHLELDEEDEDFEENKAIRAEVERITPLRGLEEGMADMMAGVLEIARLNCPHQPVSRATPKIGRNDPCPCGSGKKFKQCCGKTA